MSSEPFLSKVIIDTNVWISAIFWGGKPRQVIEAWIDNRFSLIISSPLRRELYKTIEKKAKVLKLFPDYALKWLEIISQRAILIHPKEKIEICRHSKDNMLLEASVEGKVDYLVTGDKDLLTIKTFKNTKILKPARFLEILTKNKRFE